MKLFQSALEKFETLGVSPNRSRLNGKLLTAVITYWFDCTLHCTYLVREVNSFSEFADTIFMIFTTTLVSTCFTIFIFNKTEIFRLVDDGEKMTEQVLKTNPASKNMIRAAINQIEKWSRITYYVITRIIPLGFIWPKPIVSLFIYFTSELGEDLLVLPTPTWFPFDTKNPIGYLIAVFFEYVFMTYMCVFLASLLSIGIAAFLYGVTIFRELNNYLNSIDEISESHEDQSQIMKKLTVFIQIHSKMKQLFLDLSDVCQPFFIVSFTSAIVLISMSLLLIQTELSQQDIDFVVLITVFSYVCFPFFMQLIICELSQRGCDLFNNINEILIQLKWYSLPNKIQRILPLLLIVVQQPIEIVCLGSILCNRDTFKNILNKAYSWFMMLRHFGEQSI